MIYEKTTLRFPNGSSTWMNVIYDYFSTFTDRFSLVDGYLVLDNKASFRFTNSETPTVYTKCNDANNTEVYLGSLGRWNRVNRNTYGIVTFLLTTNVFYFTIVQSESTTWYDCSGEVMITLDDNGTYYTGYAHETFNANSITFCNMNTAVNTYTLGLMFKFATQSEKILWGNVCFMMDGAGYFSNVSTLINCSNITQGIVITMNGKNYYTLGTNILVSIDD